MRLAGCNLDCSYCDTRYARDGGRKRSIDDIASEVRRHGCILVEVTGGEPLAQPETPILCARLLDEGYTVLVETNGSYDISVLPQRCIRIVDIKCPGSGEAESFLNGNLKVLTAADECKFVLTGRSDFDWALAFVKTYGLSKTCTAIFTPAGGVLELKELAQWILDADAPVHLGLQLHKVIWGPEARGV